MNAVVKPRYAPRSTPVSRESAVHADSRVLRMMRKVLLVCGILSSLLYGAMIGAIRFEGYDPLSQTVSELSAIGAPTRPLWTLLGSVYECLWSHSGWACGYRPVGSALCVPLAVC